VRACARFDFEQNKITDILPFEAGNVVMVTGGRNMGRAGVIVHKERHLGGFDIVHVKDVLERTFATRLSNVFVIGEGHKPAVSLPRGGGTQLTIAEERDAKRKSAAQ
jgi:small subunit ribosomal protein S4e